MLVRLLYCSRAVDTSPEVIESILGQARQHNPHSGITGILCYGSGIFLQAIEGGRMKGSELFGAILNHAPHKDVALLHFEEILERRFGDWSMGQVNISKINHATLLKYSETAELDPYSVSGTVSLSLLEDLMATAAICARV